MINGLWFKSHHQATSSYLDYVYDLPIGIVHGELISGRLPLISSAALSRIADLGVNAITRPRR